MNLIIIKKIKNIFNKILLTEDALPLFESEHYISNSSINLNFCSFGHKNKKKVFYVIRRSPGAGMFSNVTFIINHLKICDQYNFIPV